MANLPAAIAAAREALAYYEGLAECNADYDPCAHEITGKLSALLAALDAAQGEAVGKVVHWPNDSIRAAVIPSIDLSKLAEGTRVYLAPQAPPAAVAAANVTPMRQPRADLARLVESINVAVYANGYGLSVTEAIGALELAKLELLKEQEQ